MDAQLVIAISAVVGAMTTIIAFIAGKRERVAGTASKHATAASEISQAFNRLNDALESRIENIEKERILQTETIKELKICVDQLEDKVNLLEKEVAILEGQKMKLAEENDMLIERIIVLENGTK